MWATSELVTTEFDRIVEAHNGAARQDATRLAHTNGFDVRTRIENTLRERVRRFRELLEALPAAVYTTDAAGRITFYNQAAVELWGCRPELGKSTWCGSWRLYWPDGTPMRHDECPMAVALKENRAVRGAEAVAERPDGTRVPFIPYPTPLRDASGNLIGAVNMLVDITDRKQAEERVMMLAGEVVHRANNLLAAHAGGNRRGAQGGDPRPHPGVGARPCVVGAVALVGRRAREARRGRARALPARAAPPRPHPRPQPGARSQGRAIDGDGAA
jgi:PAS domain S-box-containing protein